MARRAIVTTLVVLVLLAAVGVVWAQTSPNYDNSWHVLSAGGREWMTSDTYVAHGTLSQFAIGPATSGQTSVGSGYWYGIRPRAIGYGLFLPLIYKTTSSR